MCVYLSISEKGREGVCVCVCVCVAHSTGYLTLEVRRGPKQGCMARLTGMASLLDSAGRQVRAGPGHRIGPGRLGHGKTCSQAGAVRPSEAPCSSLLALPATWLPGTIETWKSSSQNTRGHLYKHNPKPATPLKPELCCSGTRVNCCPHLWQELELEPLQWRRRRGQRGRRRSGDLPQGERDLHLLTLRQVGEGGSILRRGLSRLGGGWGQGASTAVAVICWPSICPPSMCLSAFAASSGFSNST